MAGNDGRILCASVYLLFLTSGYATLESRITAGVWAVLAYTSVYRIFQMDDDLLFLEWPWHILPFRVSVLVDNKIGVVFFQLASTLYQIATRLSRYFLTLPSDDWRLRRSQTLLNDLRSESLRLFEEALSKAHGEAGGICEYQWLGYFFVAKLQAKLSGSDVVKVVDGLYEAACSCELSEFFYPIKINVKKQQNIEPVELHYQVHSTVWKYLCRTPDPPLKMIVSLLAYLRAMQSHKRLDVDCNVKVVRSNLSLFSSHPELHETVINMTISCERRVEENDVAIVVNDIVTRVDLMDEIWHLCHRGFELVGDRFPHMKSYYRLAEMELSRGNVEVAYNHLTKHVFRRKKRDDSLFDSVVEITSQDIDRSGSFPYHVERALQLTMSLAYQLKDASTIISIITTLVANVEARSEEFILKERQGALLMHAVSRLYILAMESSSPKLLRSELYRAWQVVSRCRALVVRTVETRLQAIIQHIFGSVANFIAEQSVIEDNKRKQVRKRKLTSYDLGALQSHPVLLVPGAVSSPLEPSAGGNDPLKLMRLALQHPPNIGSRKRGYPVMANYRRINLRENSSTNLLPIKSLVPKKDEITSMIWSGTGQTDILAALLDRNLKLYDAQSNSFNQMFQITGGEGPVQGLHCLENGKVVSCVESGQVNIWSESGDSCRDWEAGCGVKVMRGSNPRKEILTGGLKHLIKTWDVETGKRVWSARNMPLDFLGLEVPIMCTDARYVDESGVIVEATKLHEMRLYDPRAQRRPVKKIPFMDVPITAVSRCYKDNHVLAANSIGEMGLFDLRSKSKCLKFFQTFCYIIFLSMHCWGSFYPKFYKSELAWKFLSL
ncbi:hypothetical protein ANCDUO_02250 [Ancylostoma duodenale]|uniref:WD domain, G-beta repeat protein n=1 Tax=Ancylostoma duodenale TaxID=51022 RepID=A0A0C2HD01_9BILA|nr:hypothetical protein ANCDUO_02250 [Ancylostoma duodenale]